VLALHDELLRTDEGLRRYITNLRKQHLDRETTDADVQLLLDSARDNPALNQQGMMVFIANKIARHGVMLDVFRRLVSREPTADEEKSLLNKLESLGMNEVEEIQKFIANKIKRGQLSLGTKSKDKERAMPEEKEGDCD
jgi:hypothetical protein